MRYKILFAPVAMLLFMGSTCKRECKDISQDPCDGVICTMEYRSIMVAVTDANGQRVLIDSTSTIGQSGQKIANIDLGFGTDGRYTVVDDHYQSVLKNKTEKVQFYALRNGAVVAHADFLVSADCCHISKVSGPETIIAQ